MEGSLFSDIDYYMMKLALEESKRAFKKDEVPIGAVVAKGKEVISIAHNLRHSTNIATRHAEIIAIENANKILGNWRLTGCTLYVTIEPCSMCAGAIYNSRIERLIYGAKDFRGGACGTCFDVLSSPSINHHCKVFGGLMEEEALHQIQSFFKIKRAKK